jgi:hypothetical protein
MGGNPDGGSFGAFPLGRGAPDHEGCPRLRHQARQPDALARGWRDVIHRLA